MTRPSVRKFTLVVHVVASVGWIGAAAATLPLAVNVATTDPPTTATVAAMRSIGWWVLVPAGAAALATGVVQSLTTRWGLVGHYWVIIKLVSTAVAAGVLLLYMGTLGDLPGTADPAPLVHALLAITLLVFATVLSIYKPRGTTRWARAGCE